MSTTTLCFMLVMLHNCLTIDDKKRILLHDDININQAFTAMQAQLDLLNRTQENIIKQLENEIKRLEQSYAAGSDFNYKGAAVDYLCLPQHPSWAKYVDGYDSRGAEVMGAEYEFSSMSNAAFGKNLHDEDVPCVVCKTPRPTTLMTPARTQCYPGWTLEYTGYLMAGYRDHLAATEYVCVDSNPEEILKGEANTNGKLFYFVEIHCGGLPCQIYPEGRE